jgi:MFS transporter, NNP family, nitrate/nitrite transporter
MDSEQNIATMVLKSEKKYIESAWKVAIGWQTLLVALPYACTFGAELAVEGIISSWYIQQSFQDGLNWTEKTAGAWAAMFGLLNIFTRPFGGWFADILFKRFPVEIKKYWMIFLGVAEGFFCLFIGLYPSMSVYKLIAIMSGLAIAMEAGNGANFALVPHLNPQRNGLVSGMVGAAGNFGGILFSLVFRFTGTDYGRGLWISGVIILFFHVFILWIPIHCRR